MDTNIEKSYPKLKNVKPYGKNEVIPDEIKNWEEFDRALVTFIVDCVDHSEDNNNNGKKWYGIHRIQDISLSVWKPVIPQRLKRSKKSMDSKQSLND